MLPLHLLSVLLVVPLSWAQDLRSELNGAKIEAVFPGDPGYTAASQPFNLRFELDPAVVAFPTNVRQVAQIVSLGGNAGLQVVARSGGHSYVANGLGGENGTIVVDLKGLASVAVNPTTHNAFIGGGARLGDIVLGLHGAGRAMPHGTCPYVGIGGHSTHGGFGFTSRMWGLTLDNIVSVEVVLANGNIVKASKTANSDLFWAIRGSGSSFGIVTTFEFKTFAVPSFAMIFQYNWQLNYTLAAEGLGHFQDFVKTNIPPEWGAQVILTPGRIEGNVSFGLTGSWYGEAGPRMNATVQPFLKAMPPLNNINFLGNGTFIDNLNIFAGNVLNTSTGPDVTDAFYAKSLMTPESAPLNAASRLAMMRYLANEGFHSSDDNLAWFMQLELYGGSNSAINAVPLDATSFGKRDAQLTMQFYTQTRDNKPPFPDAGFGFLDGLIGNITSNMPKTWRYGAYLNYIDDRLPDWQHRYYDGHYQRLRALKRKYDPKNVFSFPLSVEEPRQHV